MAANEPLNELSTTDASNTPVGTDVVGSTLDNELRSIKANIARSARWEQTATQSVAVTLAVSALHKLFPVEGSVGGSTTITLPEVASAGAGFSVAFKKIDNVNDVIIDGNGAEQIDGAASRTMKAQYEGLVLVCNGSSWDVAADGERLVVPSFTVDGALNTGTLFVNSNEVTGLEGVPTPANPGEDTYLLEASGGTWAWQSPANVKTNMSFGALADLNTVDTAQIDDDAVTLGKLEHGASGDILYYGAAGEPFRLAKGTDTQILTLASGLPSWADAAAGGGVPTGSVTSYLGTTAPTGWLLLNGDTLGSASSGATQASADNEDLFNLLWNNFADSEAAVSSGRGASAAADWSANKTIAIPDATGRTIFGKESSATRITSAETGVDGSVMGDSGGTEAHALAVAELASHAHSYTAPTGNATDVNSGQSTGSTATSTGSQGSGSTHTNLPPALILSWIVKV